MQLQAYQLLLANLPFGKRLPTAVYILRTPTSTLGAELDTLISTLDAHH